MKDEKEKPMFQLSDGWNSSDFLVLWSLLPEKVLEHIDGSYYGPHLAYHDGELVERSYVYFRKVGKFRKKDLRIIETDDYIVGL
jgi:hypothetical protein